MYTSTNCGQAPPEWLSAWRRRERPLPVARLKAEPVLEDGSPYRPALAKAVAGTAEALAAVTAEALADRNFDRWAKRFASALEDGHAEAWRLGRALSGGAPSGSEADRLVARAVVDQESEWYLKFMADLEEGRYDGSEAAAAARSRTYAAKMRGTANRAWLENGPEDAEIHWTMTAAEHCLDCPVIESLGPYRPDELAFVPGEGGTQCLTNCKCVLVRSDGATGFGPL
jgi:hypothetical protein